MNIRKIVLVVAAAVIGIGLGGCKKKEQPAAPPETMSMEDMQKQAGEMKETASKMAEEAEKAVTQAAAETEQTMCPVMDGNKIDKNVFTEYKGKKVYFCCEACKAKFEADPEKYVANLPQFKQ